MTRPHGRGSDRCGACRTLPHIGVPDQSRDRKGANVLFALMTVAVAGHAATLRGMVVEAQTGKPLARALIVVQPVAGGAGATQSIRSNGSGVFLFPPMPAGAYLVSAARRAFAPIQYGQKGWKSSGVPVMLQESEETSIRIAMPRFGAITGRIVDENDVGLPEHEVIAYRNTRPPVVVAKAATDDRGAYRIFGLEPGNYVVRSATKLYDDGGYLPTFYNNVSTVDSARPVEVLLDQDTPDILIRPTPGRLHNIAGTIFNANSRLQITVTLISDMGTESVTPDSSGRYRFTPVAPGKYDVYAQAFGGRGQGMLGAFQPLEIERDQTNTDFMLRPEPEVQFVFEDPKGAPVDSSSIQIIALHKMLSGDMPAEFLRPANNRQNFAPGRWEFSLAPNAGFYVIGEHQVVLRESNVVVKFVLSMSPAAVHGVVTNDGGRQVAGIPVYLERGPGDVRTTRTDVNGEYHFFGLAPGTYRILSTFAAYSTNAASPVTLAESSDVGQPLLGQAIPPGR
jgi:large repetitive protein